MQEKSNDQIEIVEENSEGYRVLTGSFLKFVIFAGVLMSLVHLYVLTIHPINPWIFRALHLFFASVITFCLMSYKRDSQSKMSLADIAWIVLSFGVLLYIIGSVDQLTYRAGFNPTMLDVIAGTFVILMSLEMTRRLQGWILPLVAIVFMLYAVAGPYLPSLLKHKGYTFERLISFLFSQEGIYGTALDASATFVFMFVLFGAFLQGSGVGEFIINLSKFVAGSARGGPAKVAVAASALMGTVSGSAVSNVVTTGSITIPLMKSIGYRPDFAGAVETVASAGGQILPPVMSAAAFVMAEVTGFTYIEIVKAATIPAILYYMSAIFIVDIEAINLDLKGLPREKLPKKQQVLSRLYLFIPLLVLISSLAVLNVSPLRAGFYAIIAVLMISWVNKVDRMTLNKIITALYEGAKGTVGIAATCAVAGIVIGVLSLTGLGLKFGNIIISLSGGNLYLTLILGMIITTILGMGLPTIASYLMAAVTVAPALIELGVPLLTAHLFVFYYACLSTITPPVAIAAYAAAGIANCDPMKTAVTAVRIGLMGFIVPYMFIFTPTLLMEGSELSIITSVLAAILGIIALANALQRKKQKLYLRMILFITSMCFLWPDYRINLIGILLVGVLALTHMSYVKAVIEKYFRKKTINPKTEEA